MTSDDHLDKETSLTAILSENGIQAKAKSRFVSGVDRLLGNVTEIANVFLESKTGTKRSRIEAEKLLIQAAVSTLTAEVREDKLLAKQILENGFSQMSRRQLNKEKVIEAATIELKNSPPTKENSTTGPSELSDEFLNRFERYSEDASEDEVRAKWAKVLAAEIKSPGQFSAKVMRTLDEIDNQTATLFTNAASHRIGSSIPKALYNPAYTAQRALDEAGLIKQSITNIIQLGVKVTDNAGNEFWLVQFGKIAISFHDNDLQELISKANRSDLISWSEKDQTIGIVILGSTAIATSIMEILDDNSLGNCKALVAEFRKSKFKTSIYSLDPVTNNWIKTAY
ncbi:DUF2806 domain-containing protein [Sulfitobacter pontiacus]|uniref:DUF2806 domain-containing protein n=1 Tax=Sulfitobacter pontiacus TaxID=60137 RepID=UPI0021A83B0A|nr:DUF2806 domain-containing protein [Sulfitobacter pontiacus]UWR19755.1 DUF2806 domain-containing protein [Sulfitobacter pontiacus]